MNTLRNKVQLIGNLGNDPEIVNLESGKTLAKFAIATNENYKNAEGEKVTDTQWHNVVAWGKTAEIIEKYGNRHHGGFCVLGAWETIGKLFRCPDAGNTTGISANRIYKQKTGVTLGTMPVQIDCQGWSGSRQLFRYSCSSYRPCLVSP